MLLLCRKSCIFSAFLGCVERVRHSFFWSYFVEVREEVWFSPSCWGEAEGTTLTWVVSPILKDEADAKHLSEYLLCIWEPKKNAHRGGAHHWEESVHKYQALNCHPWMGWCGLGTGSLDHSDYFGQEDKLLSGHCPFLPTPPSKKPSDVRMEMAPLLCARSGCMQERNARHQQPGEAFLAVWEQTTRAFLCRPLYKVLLPS